jgi:hypothetical protein
MRGAFLAAAIFALLLCDGCKHSDQLSGPRIYSTCIGINQEYPGMKFHWRKFPHREEPDSDYIFVEPQRLGDVTLTVQKSGSRDEFTVTSSCTREMVAQWGGTRARSNDYDDSLQVGDLSFDFRDGKVAKIHVKGSYNQIPWLRISSKDKSILWPCTPEELKAVLGQPLSETSAEEEVHGF